MYSCARPGIALDREGTIPEHGHGIGFLNVYRRRGLFYGTAAEFTVESRAGEGTEITMVLPWREVDR